MTTQEKSKLRKAFQQKLGTLTKEKIAFASETICYRIIGTDFFQKAKYIGCFSARNHEPSLEALWASGKQLAFPKVNITFMAMTFYETSSPSDLIEGAYRILEPKPVKEVRFGSTDIILVPALAFDELGNRLGSGLGYYDRYLDKNPNILKVGIGFEIQMSEKPLPVEAHDKKLDYLITESKLHRFKRQ